jgi:hypothetical protein
LPPLQERARPSRITGLDAFAVSGLVGCDW